MPSEYPDDRDREYRPARRNRNRDDEYDRPRRSGRSDDQSQVAVTILGVLSLAKGIMALITSVIPCFGMFAIGLASISLLLGIIGIVIAKSKNQGMALPVAGTAVSGLAVAFSLTWILIGAAIIGGFKKAGEAAEKEREQRQIEQQAKQVEVRNGPAISMTAVELYDDYDTNEMQADAKYKGKVLEITGKVVRVNDLRFDFTVELEGDETDRDCIVKCEFRNENRHSLSAIKAKQTVKIRGRCRWMLNRTVYVEDCVLVQ